MKKYIGNYVIEIEKENIETGEFDTIGGCGCMWQAILDKKLPELLKEYKQKTKGTEEYVTITIYREWLDAEKESSWDCNDDNNEDTGGLDIHISFTVHKGRYFRNSLDIATV